MVVWKLSGVRLVVVSTWLMSSALAYAAPPALEDLFADPSYRQLTISPDGNYFGVIVPVEGRDSLITLKTDKTTVVGQFGFRDSNESVSNYTWVKDNHLVFRPVTVFGWNDTPTWYGELFATAVDGKNFRSIYGIRAGGGREGLRLKTAESTWGSGYLINEMLSEEEDVLIASYPWNANGVSQPTLERVNLRTGVSRRVMGSPAANARFLSSPSGDVRFATAVNKNEIERVFEYFPEESDWKEISRNSVKSSSFEPIGLSADSRTAYYLSDSDAPNSGLFALDLVERKHTLLHRHATHSIQNVQLDPWTGEPLWITHSVDDSVHFLNSTHKLSVAMQLLEKSFKGHVVRLTSITRDRKKAVFFVYSDRDPGVWYTLDLDTRKAHLELESRPEINPEAMVSMQPISLKARDGLELHGYYTAKPRSDDRKPPLVLLVHGGPHAQDEWRFDPEVQMLATRGYAVLQVNFRGSTGYGRAFEHAGRGEWGRAMQDDLTDATRWAIETGRADSERICIMGGSYGGYASLMGLVREPELYKCGIDMFGVSDMEEFFTAGDIPDILYGKAYLKSAIGTDRAEWDARSPTKQAHRIKAPLLIIAGGQDKRVPISHSEMMEKALKRIGKPVETLYFDSEGHGFAKLEHRVQAYQKVLDFLAANIGKGEG